MEIELRKRELRKKVLEYTLNNIFVGTLKGALIALPVALLFRSKMIGYFVLSYSVGIYLSKSNDFLVENINDIQ